MKRKATLSLWLLVIFFAVVSLLVISCKGQDDEDINDDDDDDVADDDDDSLDPVGALALALDYLASVQNPEGFWMGEFVSDSTFNSDYILLMHYLDRVDPDRQAKAARYILDQQQPDGGWYAWPGGPSQISFSVLNYFALKLAGFPADDPALANARAYILSQGGAEAANMLIKIKLALFGQYPWDVMLPINTNVMLIEKLLYRVGYYHAILIPMTAIYENFQKVIPPPECGAGELFFEEPFGGSEDQKPRSGCCQQRSVDWMLERQEADGNWAGVFINTFFMLLALQSTGDAAYDPIIEKGMQGVRLFQIETQETIIQQFSQPPVMDTAYVMHTLLSAGMDSDEPMIQKAVDYLLSKQTKIYGDWHHNNPEGEPGGWGFEHHNQWYPDVDCAVMVLDAFARLDAQGLAPIRAEVSRGLDWVVSMQNDDGGWAAWDKNAVDIRQVILALNEPWVSADLSTADLTSRVLMALANLEKAGFEVDSQVIERGLAFVKSRQKQNGTWYGRWGVNYTYGTGQALQALAVLGEDTSQPRIQQAVAWLKSVQNADGGWGESPESYHDPALAGVGPSTAFQTAYVLIGLIGIGEKNSETVDRGIQYLVDTMAPDGSWFNEQYLGVGIDGYWYCRYDLTAIYKATYALVLYLTDPEGI